MVAKKKSPKKPKRGRQGEGGGRPSKKTKLIAGTLPLDMGMIETLYGFGMIDEQVAQVIGISIDALNDWKKDEKFLLALKAGKRISDDRVERSLYERATGYSHPDVDIRQYEGQVIKTEIIKHYPPDPTSMIFWLKNRRRAEWRDKQEVEHSGVVVLKPDNIKKPKNSGLSK